jgi:hypothetical protein
MNTIQDIVDTNRLLYPSLFSSFLTKNETNENNMEVLEVIPSKLIRERICDTHCSVPFIIQNIDENEPVFFADKRKERIQFTLNYLKDIPEYNNLYNYIINPNTKLLGISTNKLYLRKAISCNTYKKGYCPPQLKNKNTGWMLLIDNQSKILGFIVLDII